MATTKAAAKGTSSEGETAVRARQGAEERC